jgi:uncharacterized protein DUF3846
MHSNDGQERSRGQAWYRVLADGTVTLVEWRGKRPTLDELQGAVDGMVEHVQLDGKTELWVNEEGKLIGLPVNRTATAIWATFFGPTDTIRGDVLVSFSGTTKRGAAVRDLLEHAAHQRAPDRNGR